MTEAPQVQTTKKLDPWPNVDEIQAIIMTFKKAKAFVENYRLDARHNLRRNQDTVQVIFDDGTTWSLERSRFENAPMIAKFFAEAFENLDIMLCNMNLAQRVYDGRYAATLDDLCERIAIHEELAIVPDNFVEAAAYFSIEGREGWKHPLQVELLEGAATWLPTVSGLTRDWLAKAAFKVREAQS